MKPPLFHRKALNLLITRRISPVMEMEMLVTTRARAVSCTWGRYLSRRKTSKAPRVQLPRLRVTPTVSHNRYRYQSGNRNKSSRSNSRFSHSKSAAKVVRDSLSSEVNEVHPKGMTYCED
jgi:hypothetical protein